MANRTRASTRTTFGASPPTMSTASAGSWRTRPRGLTLLSSLSTTGGRTTRWRPKAAPALLRYGIRRFDRRTLLDERRYVTRTLAGLYRRDATDPMTGELLAAGLRFTSRLPPAWECWALWEPLGLDAVGAEIERVTIDTPQLRTAAAMLGVVLAE